VADECRIVPDALDAARIRKAPDRADDAARSHVDDGEAGLAIARRDREERRRGARRLGTEQDRGSGETEEAAAVHDASTVGGAGEVLRRARGRGYGCAAVQIGVA